MGLLFVVGVMNLLWVAAIAAFVLIEKLVPYACTWQIKENVWYGAKQTPIDLPRLRAIIEKVGYRGFLPIEALGQGDPATIVTAFLEKVRKAMA